MKLLLQTALVSAFHVLLFGPFLVFVGLAKPEHRWVYVVLSLLGMAVMVNFVTKILSQKWGENMVWYTAHAAVIAPTMLYIGWHQNNTPNSLFSLAQSIGMAATGYHALKLLKMFRKS